MRILLISPRDSTYSHDDSAFTRSLSYYALTLPTLAALVPAELGATVRIVDEGVESLTGLAACDLVGLTAVTPSAPRAYEIARQARLLGKTVVMGGPHATLLPDEAASHADAVVTGLAEVTWPRLLRDFAAGKLQKRYGQDESGTIWKVPAPRRELLNLKRYLKADCVQSSRGCSAQCTFCTIPRLWGRSAHVRPVPDVIAEIVALPRRNLVLLDPSLGDDRGHALQFLQALAPLNKRWVGLGTVADALDEELMEAAVKSGCRGLLLGFESLVPASLASVRKPVKDQLRAVKNLHARGVCVLGCFVFGLEEDDPSVFERTAEFADAAQIDIVRYAVLTPYPGTELFADLERQGRILTRDWSRYDMQHVVFRPHRMSPAQLQAGLHRAWQRSTSLGSIFRRSRAQILLPLVTAVNFGFRHYAAQLMAKTRPLPGG